MNKRFRMFRRGRIYWCQDNETGKQESLGTDKRQEAAIMLHAKNEAHRQPTLNLQVARAYLMATDPEVAKRTWQGNRVPNTKGAYQPFWSPNSQHIGFFRNGGLWKVTLPNQTSSQFAMHYVNPAFQNGSSGAGTWTGRNDIIFASWNAPRLSSTFAIFLSVPAGQ